MPRSRDRLIPGILSTVSFLAVTYFLLVLSAHPYTLDLKHSSLCATLISAFNISILFSWLTLGEFGGIPVSILSIIVVLFFGLRTDVYKYAVYLVPFIIANLVGFACYKRREKMEQDGILKSERLEEEMNLLSDNIGKRKNEIRSLEEKFIRYSALKSVAEAFSTKLSLDDISDLIITKTVAVIGKPGRVLLFLVDVKRQELTLAASKDISKIMTKKGDVFDNWVLKNRKPLIAEDITKDFRFPTAGVENAKSYLKSMIAAPLVSENKTIGILRMDSLNEAVYTQDDLRLLDIISDLGAVAIENAVLYSRTQELAIRDGLTGLFLHRYFKNRLHEETNRAARTKGVFSLLLLDIDHFKDYNDKYGHMAGDLVLKYLARKILSMTKEGDIVARYGGEEIAVLLSETDKDRAARKAESIRRGIEEEPFILRRQKMCITVSIGVSNYPEDAALAEELIRSADERLYKAKSDGRNRICAGS